MIKLEIKASA